MARYLWGLLLLLLGGAFLLSNIGLLDIEFNIGWILATFWPAILIIWGVSELINALNRLVTNNRSVSGSVFTGLLLTFLGLIFLGNNLDWFSISFRDIWTYAWPLLIIYIGFKLILNNRFHQRRVRKWKNDKHLDMKTQDFPVRRKMMVGDMKIGRGSWNLEDMTVWLGAGDVDIDLTKAIIPAGETIIDISGFVGEISVLIPENLSVHVDAKVRVGEVDVLGDSANGTGRSAFYQSEDYNEAIKKVYIVATLSAGEIDIRRAD
ncbi:cell wall-active antibiotics response protein LiaF [Bacillus horti]|uniref:Lia operon protein LiaF n=1 Tax=Caldalkalibacillus horti TaxID=77523 RepID=A0ABT9VVQ9_9BACI|nr:cell wall-active antibiotics response protein LiaF [Bacillus horti]MDQ0165081.1 lia operon protein LiaF [Bacillus horti]